jgi:GH15 family glucan-1,4-alpha-glucosidase
MSSTAASPQELPSSSHVNPVEIQDYGMIGDCRAAALISREGSLDWLCWPRFDHAAIFAGLLDRGRGGHWSLAPAAPFSVHRRYLPGTNILETSFETEGGAAEQTDLMTVSSEFMKNPAGIPDHEIVRRAACTKGEVKMRLHFVPRDDYGCAPAKIRPVGKLGVRVICGNWEYWLRSNMPLISDGTSCFGEFVLQAGQVAIFSFSYCNDAPSVLPPVDDAAVVRRIEISAQWWRNWSARAQYDGEYRDAVVRSALTLKMLSYAPSGAVIAAPTTSLPERIGGSLNWDYRFCWLRDASLTIRALLELGFWEEADDFMEWLLQATRLSQPELHILYSVYGNVAPREKLLTYLSGYKNSQPVRIGNAARDQLQLDVYGELIDAAAQFAFHGRPLDREMQGVLIALGNYVVNHWDQPDEGIWEPRSGRANHTHSRLLCWAAMDRLITLHDKGQLNHAPVDQYKRAWLAIRKQIAGRAWNPKLQTYVSTLDSDELDASLLLISWYGFDKASSHRMQGTYRALREHLGAGEALLYRYRTEPAEGAFAICSFWAAEYVALGGGSTDQAHRLIRELLNYRNDLGLYAEEIDPNTGAALGNFPQAFTHIGLISAALSLRQRETGEQQLAHREETANPQKANHGAHS